MYFFIGSVSYKLEIFKYSNGLGTLCHSYEVVGIKGVI